MIKVLSGKKCGISGAPDGPRLLLAFYESGPHVYVMIFFENKPCWYFLYINFFFQIPHSEFQTRLYGVKCQRASCTTVRFGMRCSPFRCMDSMLVVGSLGHQPSKYFQLALVCLTLPSRAPTTQQLKG